MRRRRVGLFTRRYINVKEDIGEPRNWQKKTKKTPTTTVVKGTMH